MSKTNYNYGGKYKEEDNVILEIDSLGLKRSRFKPISVIDTPIAMEQLELSYLASRDEIGINKLLLIPCLILDFLCIHPFKDRNGRMSRLLSLLLLYKNEYDVGKYIFIEEKINDSKKEYYEALKASSINWENNQNDYFPFIEYFLFILFRCYKELHDRFILIDGRRASKKVRIEKLVLDSIRPISKIEIYKSLVDVSVTTIEKVLGDLVKANKIKIIGKGRSTRYIRN